MEGALAHTSARLSGLGGGRHSILESRLQEAASSTTVTHAGTVTSTNTYDMQYHSCGTKCTATSRARRGEPAMTRDHVRTRP